MTREAPTISSDDADLLQQFAITRSPEAFRQLVDRHLPAVHATANRILRDSHLAEDVTQSVFILLAQRAPKIKPGPLFGWLYQVTHYACTNAKRIQHRRQKYEQEAAAMRPTSQIPTSSDAQALLDPALLSLSAPDRDILLLRYTADLPLAEIARLTSIPQETAKKRLHRALTKLRSYFAAQGLLSAAPLALHSLTPALPPVSLAPTITAAALAPAAATSTSLLIAKGVSHLMLTAKLAKIGLIAAILLLTTTAAGITVQHLLAPTPPAPAAARIFAAAPAVARQSPETIQVTGIIEDEQGKPYAGASVWDENNTHAISDAQGQFTMTFVQGGTLFAYFVASSPDGSLLAYKEADHVERISSPSDLRLVLRPAKELIVNVADAQGAPVADALVATQFEFKNLLGRATSNAQGVAIVRYPADIPQLLHVIAAKANVGLDYVWFSEKGAAPRLGLLDGNFQGPVSLVLNGTRTINIHVADDDQQPLAGATIKLDEFRKANKGNNDFTVDLNDQLLPGLFSLTTDAQGNAASAIIPLDAIMPLSFTLERKFMFHITKDGHLPRAFTYDPAAGKDQFNITLSRPVHIVTRVSDSTGNAIARAHVYVYGREAADSVERASGGSTSEDGMFAFDGNPNVYYTFIAQIDTTVSPVTARLIRPGTKPDIIDLKLQPGIHIHGHVTAGPNNAPPTGRCTLTLRMKDESYLKLPADQQTLSGDTSRLTAPFPVRNVLSDQDGSFEFYALPGSYTLSLFSVFPALRAPVVVDEKKPTAQTEFELTHETDRQIDLHSDPLPQSLP